eukprot:TRINITY_DN25559_c0_g1_i1.p1 TRINITY_DN25559_c0_g1~~TRINITY_DN25559_c0_g1_i1.p1  ORF type:complete len:420 (-),score=81.99 TRINITY_DN25559_c0_g1_i1:13-1272(-)
MCIRDSPKTPKINMKNNEELLNEIENSRIKHEKVLMICKKKHDDSVQTLNATKEEMKETVSQLNEYFSKQQKMELDYEEHCCSLSGLTSKAERMLQEFTASHSKFIRDIISPSAPYTELAEGLLLVLGFQFGSWETFQRLVKKTDEFIEFLSQYNLRQFGQDEYMKVVDLRNKYNLSQDSLVKKIDEEFGKLLSWMYLLTEQKDIDTKLQKILQSLGMINEECGRMQDILANKESAVNDLTQKVIVLNKHLLECDTKYSAFIEAIQQIKECFNDKTEGRVREALQDSRLITQNICCLIGINIETELQKCAPEPIISPEEAEKTTVRKSLPLEPPPKPVEKVESKPEIACEEVKKEELQPIKEQEIVPEVLELSLIHISEPTRPLYISYAVFCLKKKKNPRSRKSSTNNQPKQTGTGSPG